MKKLEVLKNSFRHTIDDSVIDYHVHYDITGKIYEIKPLLYELPQSSQLLILGKNVEEKKNKIKHFGNLLTLILPLGIVNQEKFFSKELKNIYESINQYIASNQLSKNKLYEYAEPESLAFYILSSFQNPSSFPDNFNQIWTKTMDVIEKRNGSINIDNLRAIGYYYPQFRFKILTYIIPFIKNSNTRRIAYEGLKTFKDPSCKRYLLDQLKACKDGSALSGICKALLAQDLQDTHHIRKDLIDIYNSDITLNEDALANLIELLCKFPNEQTNAIGIEIIKKNKRHSSGAAARSLLNSGYPAQAIVDIVLPKLKMADPKESEAAFHILSNSDKYGKYLPGCEELLGLFVKALEKGSNLNIVYSMSGIVRNVNDKNAARQIVAHLSHEHPQVLEGILIVISHLVDEEKIKNKKAFYSKHSKKRYIALIDHPKEKVVEHALKVIQKIGKLAKEQTYIGLLLDKINFEHDKMTNLYLMWAINHILPVVKYDKRITESFLPALKNSNSNYRLAALNGLRYAKDKKFKASLAYLKDDPSKDVRRALKDLDEVPEKGDNSHSWVGILEALGVKNPESESKKISDWDSFKQYLDRKVSKGEEYQKRNIDKFRLK